jgi:hypothetical protein
MSHDWKVKIVGSEITVERSGRRTRVKHVAAGTLNALRESLRENDIFALRTVYGCSACSDNPCCTLEIADAVRTRRVQVYADSPHGKVTVHFSENATNVPNPPEFRPANARVSHYAASGSGDASALMALMISLR